MIRINLLAVERERPRRPRVFIPPAHRVTIGASLILIATILGIGWWFMSLRQQSAQLDQDIAKAETETIQLRSVLAQVQKFEARKAQLTQRVHPHRAAAPRAVGARARPRRDQQEPAGSAVADRDASRWAAISRSAALPRRCRRSRISSPALEATKWFKRPVEILDSQVQTDPKAGDLVKFSIKGTLERSRSAAAGPAAARRGVEAEEPKASLAAVSGANRVVAAEKASVVPIR